MNANTEVADTREPAAPAAGQARTVLRPSVDIFENGSSLTLLANLPGVTEKNLSLEVDGKTLIIEGEIDIDMPSEMESLHAEVRSRLYQRAFTLSSELDTEKIEASMRDGLLTVTLPKREEVKPRKIEISTS